MNNLMQCMVKGKLVWRYFFLEDGKLSYFDCDNCATRELAEKFVTKKLNARTTKYLISNITKRMYEEGSSSYNRRKYRGQSLYSDTIYQLKKNIKEINLLWGNMDIRKLTEHQVVNYLISKNRSGSWKNEFLTTLRDVYKEASWLELDVRMPNFQNFKRNSKKADCFTQKEIDKLFSPENFSSYSVYLFFLLISTAGLRLGEARGAKVKQILMDKHAFIVDGFIAKNGERTKYNKAGSNEKPKYRVVILPSFVLDKLKEFITARCLKSEDYIFTLHGKPLRQDYTYRQFKKAIAKSNINVNERKLCPHSLRFTYVTKMRLSFKPELVQRFVGHNSIEMTEYYTRMNIIDSVENLQPLIPEIDKVFDIK